MINNQGLILKEGSLMTGIYTLISINTSRVHKSRRCSMLHQIAHRRSCQMRSKTKSLIGRLVLGSIDPVSIHHLSCRMIRGKIQIIKSELLAADIVFAKHFKSKGQKG